MTLNKEKNDNTINTDITLYDQISDKLNKCDNYATKALENIQIARRNLNYNSDSERGISYIDTNHLQIISNVTSRIISLSNSLYSNLCSIESLIAPVNGNYDKKDISFIESTEIEVHDELIHIKYPVLLPKKLKSGVGSGASLDRIKATYVAAISDYFEKNKIEEYKEKATLCIIHHYPSSTYVRDHDNYSLREIINNLCTYLFVDDNAKWLSHFQDYIVDGHEYSEIYIMPSKDFPDFIKAP